MYPSSTAFRRFRRSRNEERGVFFLFIVGPPLPRALGLLPRLPRGDAQAGPAQALRQRPLPRRRADVPRGQEDQGRAGAGRAARRGAAHAGDGGGRAREDNGDGRAGQDDGARQVAG